MWEQCETLNNHIVELPRDLHQIPEVGLFLPKTSAYVAAELNRIGIPYVYSKGDSGLIAAIEGNASGKTIALRADMDALRMTEQNEELEYRSKHDGMMHACGHDAHTAILLGTAKALKEMEKELDCRVLLVFQPSEEGVTSGAMMMIENGLMEEIQIMTGLHVGTNVRSGMLGVCPGVSSATSRHFKIEVSGKSIHATSYHNGISALEIAVRLYTGIQSIVATEVDPKEKVVCVVTKLHSGTAQNIIPDYALMQGTIRTFNVSLSEFIYERISALIKAHSEQYGVEIKFHAPLKSTCVYNNPYLSELMMNSMKKIVGEENICIMAPGMGSEDFSRFTDIVPSVFFRLGIKNEGKGITQVAHQTDFKVDEDALIYGVKAFVQFVCDNQNGIDVKKAAEADDR